VQTPCVFFDLDGTLTDLRAKGGATILENLALACAPCNGARREKVEAIDPRTGRMARLFNPRIDLWEHHSHWNNSQTSIIGHAAIGRATVLVLCFNDPLQQGARRFWRAAGLL